jgi:hypothetical protein
MYQDFCTNLIVILILSTFIFAIADIFGRLFNDLRSHYNKSFIIPPTPADYRCEFSNEPVSTSAPSFEEQHQTERKIASATVHTPLTTLKSVGAAALALDAMTVRQLRDLCQSDKKRFSGYSKFVSQETQLRSFVRSRML